MFVWGYENQVNLAEQAAWADMSYCAGGGGNRTN